MRYILSLLAVFISTSALRAQNVTLEKTWIAADNTRIKFGATNAALSLSEYGFTVNYIVLNDTLRFFNIDSGDKRNHDYHMILSADSLVLTPIVPNADVLQTKNKALVLIDRSLIYDEGFDFKRIKLREKGGDYEWTDFSVEISKIGKIKYIDQSKFDKPIQYLTGRLNKNQLLVFNDLLKKSAIDHLKADDKYVYHGSTTTLDIQYNGKSKYLKQQYYPPTFWELADYLRKLHISVELKPSKAFQIFPPDPVTSAESVLKSLPGFEQFDIKIPQ